MSASMLKTEAKNKKYDTFSWHFLYLSLFVRDDSGDDISGSGSGMCQTGHCARSRPGGYPPDNNRVRAGTEPQSRLYRILILFPLAVLLLLRWWTDVASFKTEFQDYGGTMGRTFWKWTKNYADLCPFQKKRDELISVLIVEHDKTPFLCHCMCLCLVRFSNIELVFCFCCLLTLFKKGLRWKRRTVGIKLRFVKWSQTIVMMWRVTCVMVGFTLPDVMMITLNTDSDARSF
jgi:hypothetical protein